MIKSLGLLIFGFSLIILPLYARGNREDAPTQAGFPQEMLDAMNKARNELPDGSFLGRGWADDPEEARYMATREIALQVSTRIEQEVIDYWLSSEIDGRRQDESSTEYISRVSTDLRLEGLRMYDDGLSNNGQWWIVMYISEEDANRAREDMQSLISPYTGDGGEGRSIIIRIPRAEGLPDNLRAIHIQAHGRLLHNFTRYSSLTVVQDLDFGPVTDYSMTGSISERPLALGYNFYLQVEGSGARIAYAFSDYCTFSELIYLSIVDLASSFLLQQMGVQLTEWARAELEGTVTANRARAETVMREAGEAEQAGEEARARALYRQVEEMSAQLADAARIRSEEMDRALGMFTVGMAPSPILQPPPQLIDFAPIPEAEIPRPIEPTGNIRADAIAEQEAWEIQQENERRLREVEAENERIRAENERRQREVDEANRREQARVDEINRQLQREAAEENAARDAHNREIWRNQLAESEEYYRNFLATVSPLELVYENRVDPLPRTAHDFENVTISLKFNAALVPVETGWTRAVESDVNNLRSQLLATGRAEAWGFANWPETSITSPSPFMNMRRRVTVDAQLLDDNGKILGTQHFFFDWNLPVSFNATGLSFSMINEDDLSSQSVVFKNIDIYAITDILQIHIARINGRDSELAAAQGGIQFSANYHRWELLEQRQRLRAEEQARLADEQATRAAIQARLDAEERARQATIDGFLRNTGINFIGTAGGGIFIGGEEEEGRIIFSGGGEIELSMFFHRFGLQTGVNFTVVEFPKGNETLIQIPILARTNLIFLREELRAGGPMSMLTYYISPYAGIGINLSSSSQINPISPIAGLEVGFRGFSFSIFYEGRYVFSGNHAFMSYFGMGWFIPFRKS